MTEKNNRLKISNIIFSALFLALALILPFLTGQIQQFGQALCPMHLPVMLCGFICGWKWGLTVGAVSPIMRSLIFGMPVLYPQAASMAIELAVYGALAGLMYKKLGKSKSSLYAALLVAMLAGRFAWGAARFTFGMLSASSFGFGEFISGAFTVAVPGIICQLVIIPPVVILVERAVRRTTKVL